MSRRIIKMCRRCLGQTSIARIVNGKVTYRKCPRCGGKGGKVEETKP